MKELYVGACAVELVQGDITEQRVGAIVNAANSSLLGGGGVDGAIHRAGGPAILEACRAIRARQGKLPTGQAVITPAGDLPASWVIHTVGPVWRGGGAGEAALLASCYRACVSLARDHDVTSLAFPSVSTGIYGYPVEVAARVAVVTVAEALRAAPGRLELVRWVLFDPLTLSAYEAALSSLRQAAGEGTPD